MATFPLKKQNYLLGEASPKLLIIQVVTWILWYLYGQTEYVF